MAKNKIKNKQTFSKTSSITKITRHKKEFAGIIIILLILVVASVSMANGRKDTTTKVTTTKDLAKSSINIKNTKNIPTPSSSSSPSSSTAGTPTSTSTSKTSNTKPGSTTTTGGTNSSGSGSGNSSGGTANNPATPSVPFRIEDGPYTEVDNDEVSIGCNASHRFTFTSHLTANKAGTATYHWERSDGAQTGDRQAVFSAAGTIQVTNTWDLSSDGTPGSYDVSGWQEMVVTSPNETNSKPSDANFTLSINC